MPRTRYTDSAPSATEHLEPLQLVYVWYNLPLAVRPTTSLNTFKRHLETHLFQSSYSRSRSVFNCLTVFNQLLRVLEAATYGTLNLTSLTNSNTASLALTTKTPS